MQMNSPVISAMRTSQEIPHSGAPIVSVENLSVSFGKTRANVVKSVSFQIAPGETVAIVGESGSGKSVTSLAIMGLLPAGDCEVTGSVQLAGRSVLSMFENELRRMRGKEVGMIFQEPLTALNPVMTVGDQIAEVLQAHSGMSASTARKEAIRFLEKVRIPDAKARAKSYPHEFSGGMRQRAMIAMAIACKPKLLIADEPTTALDVTVQAQILHLIKELQRDQGTSVLFITHDLGVVAEIADRVVVMEKGEVVEQGTCAALFTNPTHPYTRMLLSSVPRLGSMEGLEYPTRFPSVDRVTGEISSMVPGKNTVSPNTLLRVNDLVTRFTIAKDLIGRARRRVHAVENVSFELKRGETLGLVGESGSGKSTIARTIMGLVKAQSGAINLNGKNLNQLRREHSKDAIREIQMIFQDPFASLNPRQKVGDAIAEPLLIHRRANAAKARNVALDLLRKVGLDETAAGRFPHEFSGGQRQRICIARALALNPSILIADESVSALDVTVKAQIINLLIDLQESMGLSYLFISHDMAVVERVSHRVAVLYLGELVEIGPRDEIFSRPCHPYTQKLLAAVPRPEAGASLDALGAQVEEIRSPVFDAGYMPPPRRYRRVAEGHLVMES
ncbi:ABC transporter ATP-binding protein [Paraburkholderia caledonica]|uniref:Peptide/nickel transport system ATP-binding protein n=2 Tax=Paraburkholderia caledonica TaxID=134536 RepID=A0AB73INJ9_9BURK|nr:peptide/nickel transport system ATP-binding protein [Paraburkholderia caledonica]